MASFILLRAKDLKKKNPGNCQGAEPRPRERWRALRQVSLAPHRWGQIADRHGVAVTDLRTAAATSGRPEVGW